MDEILIWHLMNDQKMGFDTTKPLVRKKKASYRTSLLIPSIPNRVSDRALRKPKASLIE